MLTELLSFFTRPWFLLAFPFGLVTLIYIYKKHGTGKKFLAASTLLLKLISTKSESRTKFKPPARFFLELLLLTLLTLAAADFFLKPSGPAIAIIADNGFGTFAKSAQGTRLDNIKEQVQSLISTLPKNSNIKIYASNPNLIEITPKTPFIINLAAALSDLQSAYSNADLNDTVSELAAQSHFDELYIISSAVKNNPEAQSKIKFRSIQPALAPINNNIAIDSLNLTNNVARVKIVSFAELAAEFILNISCLDKTSLWVTPVKQKIVLAAQAKETYQFKMSNNFSACKAELKFDPKHATLDLLAEDNTAWASSNTRLNKLTFVGELSAKESGLTKLPDYNFDYIRPDAYEVSAKDSSLYIFHRYAPKDTPNANSFYIMPTKPTQLFTALPEQLNQISYWNKTHAITRYLQLNLLKESSIQTLTDYTTLTPIISVKNGAALLAGQDNSQRVIASGLELLPYTGKDNSTISILFLNSIKWLKDDQAKQQNLLALYQNRQTSEEQQEFSYLDKLNDYSWPVDTNQHSNNMLKGPGLLEVKDVNGTSFSALNYTNLEQSNLNQPRSISVFEPNTQNIPDGAFPIKFWMILLVLAVLVIDFIVRLRKNG